MRVGVNSSGTKVAQLGPRSRSRVVWMLSAGVGFSLLTSWLVLWAAKFVSAVREQNTFHEKIRRSVSFSQKILEPLLIVGG